MRLFAALRLSRGAAAHLQARLQPLAEAPGWRWTPAASWHVTLAFYGEVAQPAAADLAARLARAAGRCPPLRLSLAGAGTFPARPGRVRVVWAAVSAAPDELAALARLAERCAAAGRRAGLDLPDRSWRPHLTLARARGDAADAGPVLDQLAGYAGPAWEARDLRLVRSTLGRGAPAYDDVAVCPLAGAGYQA